MIGAVCIVATSGILWTLGHIIEKQVEYPRFLSGSESAPRAGGILKGISLGIVLGAFSATLMGVGQ